MLKLFFIKHVPQMFVFFNFLSHSTTACRLSLLSTTEQIKG